MLNYCYFYFGYGSVDVAHCALQTCCLECMYVCTLCNGINTYVSMCVCVCVCWSFLPTCLSDLKFVVLHTAAHTYISTDIYVCIYVCMYVCTFILYLTVSLHCSPLPHSSYSPFLALFSKSCRLCHYFN